MDEELLAAGQLIAALDQLKSGLADLASLLGEYRRRLVLAGFPSDDALELCLDLQRTAIFTDRDDQ